MKKTLIILNAYIHDFASALWLVTVLLVYWVGRYVPPPGSEEFFFQVKREFFFLGGGSLVVILLTGIGRTIAYRSGLYGDKAEKVRKVLLVIKHILGFLLYGAGTYWQYRMVYGPGL